MFKVLSSTPYFQDLSVIIVCLFSSLILVQEYQSASDQVDFSTLLVMDRHSPSVALGCDNECSSPCVLMDVGMSFSGHMPWSGEGWPIR